MPSKGVSAMSDLIVIGYPDEGTAQNVWDELAKMQQDDLARIALKQARPRGGANPMTGGCAAARVAARLTPG